MSFAGMPEPGETISMQEAGRALGNLAAIVKTFPIGQPKPVTVTLTDEEWIGVCTALGAIIVHAATPGAPNLFPDWVNPAQRRALETIYNVNFAAALAGGQDNG